MFCAESFNIEGFTTYEVLHTFDRLRRADQSACTTSHDLAFFTDRTAAADGAPVQRFEIPQRGTVLPVLNQNFDDLRDYVARPLDDNMIANFHAKTRDLILVMQRRTADNHASDRHGSKVGDGCQGARPSDLNNNIFQYSDRLLRRKLMRDSPTRRPADHAKPVLPIQAIDLVDDAIDVVREIGTMLQNLTMKGQRLIHTATNA